MSANMLTYEVRVIIRDENSQYYRCDIGKTVKREIVKMFHIEARTIDQAFNRANKYGRPISAKKISMENTLASIEAKDANGDYLILKDLKIPYKNAVDMGYFIWNKKKNKVKEDIDKDDE